MESTKYATALQLLVCLGIFAYGINVLIKGRLKLGRRTALTGWSARFLACVIMLALPPALLFGPLFLSFYVWDRFR
jgi:hypothetical protein